MVGDDDSLSDAFVVRSRLSFARPAGRTDPVAPNGSGGSTPPELIVCEIGPATGSSTAGGTLRETGAPAV
jgi:hypothetical protein